MKATAAKEDEQMRTIRLLILALVCALTTLVAAQVNLPQPRKAWTVLVYQQAITTFEEALIRTSTRWSELEAVRR
jgi:hypothetical protein